MKQARGGTLVVRADVSTALLQVLFARGQNPSLYGGWLEAGVRGSLADSGPRAQVAAVYRCGGGIDARLEAQDEARGSDIAFAELPTTVNIDVRSRSSEGNDLLGRPGAPSQEVHPRYFRYHRPRAV